MSKLEIEELNWGRDAALLAILDSLSICILTLDRRGRVSYTSRSWPKFAHENGVAWLQIEPAADYLAVCRDAAQQGDPLAQQALEGIKAVLAGRFDKMSLEYPSQGSLGRQRWFLMNVDPLSAEHGGVVISHIDITEHKQMETALADREAKFRGIYESNIMPIAFWDLDGRITNANDAYLELTGYSRSELDEGKLHCSDLTPPEQLHLDKQAIQEAKSRGVCTRYEKDYQRRNGQRIPVLIGGGILPGMPDHGVVFAMDLSERKKAEEDARLFASLAECERQRLDGIVSSVPGVVWEAGGEPGSAEQELRFVSDYVETLTGYTVQEWLAEPRFWLTIMHPDDRERAARECATCFNSGQGCACQFRWIRKDGQVIWVEARLAVIRGENGEPVGLRGVTMEITERKNAESALRESEEKNRAILQALPDLIFVQSKDGVYLDYHAKDPRSLLVPPEQFIGKNMREILPPELAQTFGLGFERVMQSSEPVIEEYSLLIEGESRNYEARMVRHNGDKILSVVRDITERRQSEQALQDLVAGTAVTGEEFFPAYVRHVAAALEVQYAGVAELVNHQGSRLRTLAVWVGGGWAENYEYDVANTPCGQVVCEGKLFYCPERVQEIFPQCSPLADLNAVSYMGAPLFNSKRQLIGNLCILDSKPLGNEQRAKSILEIFAARAAAEIERKHAEEELKRALAEVERLKERLEAENVYLREEVSAGHRHREIIGESEGIRKVLQQVEQVAGTDMTVLILGETGTGKELVARAVHERSDRRERPLVKVNCSALPGELIESELFGHEKGAFTGATGRQVGRFELADGGTIFLDEVGDLPLKLQAKLLRVLQEGEFERLGSGKTIKVDVRVIAATNRNLAEAMQRGRFRLDLYYRLNVYPVQIPALRERREDIGLLAERFLGEASQRLGRIFDPVPVEVLEALRRYEWPGNVRELQNVIERAAVVSSGRRIQLTEEWAASFGKLPVTEAAEVIRSIELVRREPTLEELERSHILEVLQQTGWRVEGSKGAALILGLNPSTLRSRMVKLGIKRAERLVPAS
jgi:formate hydrogenlyase transcriptional activator